MISYIINVFLVIFYFINIRKKTKLGLFFTSIRGKCIFIFLYLLYSDSVLIYTKVNLLMIFLNVVVGLLLSPLLFNFTYFLFFRKIIRVKFKISKNNIFLPLLEEIIWRGIINKILIYSLSFISLELIQFLIANIFVSLMFLFIHKKQDDLEYKERFLYILFLALSNHYLPGSNVGLHIGRNALISSFTFTPKNLLKIDEFIDEKSEIIWDSYVHFQEKYEVKVITYGDYQLIQFGYYINNRTANLYLKLYSFKCFFSSFKLIFYHLGNCGVQLVHFHVLSGEKVGIALLKLNKFQKRIKIQKYFKINGKYYDYYIYERKI